MSNLSNKNGRGFEYACLNALYDQISHYRNCVIDMNSSFEAAKNAWESLDNWQQEIFLLSASSAVDTLLNLEPLAIEKSNDVLELFLQPDSQGEVGDVRDIVLYRKSINWEIGLSIKHNHFAVKHSRLAKTLDFSDKWFGRPCTNSYWGCISKTFEYLGCMKKENKKWSELPAKNEEVYVPLLVEFMDEIKRQTDENPDTPKRMVEYLLGEFDFYKVISMDSKKMTQIQSFNLYGTLNKSSKTKEPSVYVPIVDLPTRIVSLDFKSHSKNTVELYLDNGWQFNFRLHNASTYVETSLKFDIQIIGMPATIVSICCKWK